MTPRAHIWTDVETLIEPFGLTRKDIISQRRTRKMAWPRQMVFAHVRKTYGLSMPHIGRLFGRDHSTVHHGIQQHEARMAWVEFLRLAADVEQPDLFAWAA